MLPLNPLLCATDTPPIPAAAGWRASYDGRHGPLIDLAQAVPGEPPPAALLERIGAAAGAPAACAYGAIVGDMALRDAFAADLREGYGTDVTPADMAVTAGCNQAFVVAMMTLARAGDEVILPAPWYFNHKMTLDMLGLVARPLMARAEDGFVPRPEEARALIGPRTRALVLVSPNNPTGATYPPGVLAAFGALAREHGLALVVDETYRDFLPDGWPRPHDLLLAPAWRDTIVQLHSFSKSYAVPGHRLGALVAGPEVVAQVTKVLDCLAICPPRAAQGAVAWAVDGIRPWRRAMRDTINRRAALFAAAVADAPGWSVAAIGAYFAYVRHPLPGPAAVAAATLAASGGLVTLPGSFFGPGQEDFLRFAFANVDEAGLEAVASRLRVCRP